MWNAGYKRRLKPMKKKKGPNPHNPTRWVWIAVLVGRGKEVEREETTGGDWTRFFVRDGASPGELFCTSWLSWSDHACRVGSVKQHAGFRVLCFGPNNHNNKNNN